MKNIALAAISVIAGFVITAFGIGSYIKLDKKEKKTSTGTNTVTVNSSFDFTQESFESWTTYSKENIDLMSSFKALNNSGDIISKNVFLNLLRTGYYIPVKIDKEGVEYYQLVLLKEDTDEKIKKNIQSTANIANHYFNMEGTKLPEYDFVDLYGKSYNKEETKGKWLVLKCWFINCKTCVEEFPELNTLVANYKDKNVAFVSLASDERDKLVTFLETKPFSYATIPLQKDYMKQLQLKQYPTHLIVNKDGVIVKMVNNVKTLTSELEKIMNSR